MSRLQKLLGVGKGYLERLPPVDVHKLLRIVLMNLPYIVIFYVGNKLAWLYQYCVGDSMIERLMVLVLNFQMAFSRILPSMHNFVVAMMYSQLFNLLCDRADDVHHGRLPYHVRILCDEFANIGQIPKFDKLIATIRSREISASIILQSQSQLKTIYKDAAETILGNCDTMLFLGGKESSTLKEISETLGKETIDLYNTSDTRGQSRSYGMNYQKTGKELMSRDELAVMDGSKCILQLRGVRPFFSDKFDITKHKRYKELSDYDKKNEFDVEAYMRHRMEVKLTRTQEFDLYEFSEESLAEELNTENKEAEHVKDSDT